ncbi:MAG: HupE/UreJ family protein [Candidatus Thermoplasmatota archaeon]
MRPVLRVVLPFVGALALLLPLATAHGVAEGDKAFLQQSTGAQIGPFLYLGAKHMVTGYDHLLFLFGVIFFLFHLKDVGLYVSMFTIGHSATLIAGVLLNIQANPFLIDAIIGLSIVYKGFDNLGGFTTLFGHRPNTKLMVLVFGLFHGLGLATKLQQFGLSGDGLVTNILSFNVGVELGQFLALGLVLLLMGLWRTTKSFEKSSFAANVLIMAGGFILMGYQLAGFALQGA